MCLLISLELGHICPDQSFCTQSEKSFFVLKMCLYFHNYHILPISSVLRKLSFLMMFLIDIVLTGLLYNLEITYCLSYL